jgi:hypothetical protein
MTGKTLNCPACNGTMHYRLGEYECEGCGHKAAALAVEESDRLPARRVETPTYNPGGKSGYVDGEVQRGTRRH